MGTNEEIFKTEVKKRVSRCLPFGREIFWKHHAKWLFSLGISEEKKFHQSRNFRSLSLPTFWGTKLFFKTPTKTASLSGNKWREKIFDRTLKNILSHSSHYEDMYLDNWIKSPSSMTVRWPRKSERGDAAVRSRGRHTKGARKSGAYSAISKYLSNYLLLPEKKKNIGNCNSFQNR